MVLTISNPAITRFSILPDDVCLLLLIVIEEFEYCVP